ncbi:MAG TPA: hypothetical protein DEA08_36815 [Planctomycetes bacterium]|nr:hypothetical protein [Planctomycetota bacterium]
MSRLWLLLCAFALAGCGSLDVTVAGTLTSPLVAAPISTETQPVLLACDRLGNLTINGRPLELSAAREDTRFGLRLVDARELPRPWRPAYAEGGFLVTGLHKASPLAVAGLRPLDCVLGFNGEPVTDAASLQARLRDARRREVYLEGRRPDGEAFELAALAEDRVGESSKNHVPFLFEQRSSATGDAFAFGPLDTLFFWRTWKAHEYVADPRSGHSRYRECFQWGALANLLEWQRERDPLTGDERSRLRLFWFLEFGDDL